MELEGKTILVTGCTGFLGSHLTNSLVKQKRIRVRGLIQNRIVDSRNISDLPIEKAYGDMTSFEAMNKATKDCDIVVHCAVSNPYETIMGTRNVVKASTKNKIKKLIYISSSAVFGYSPSATEIKKKRLNHKKSKKNYLTPYSHSKIESENIALAYHDSHELPLVILRPTHIYGPKSLFWTINPIMMLEKGNYVLVNGGNTPSNIVYVADVVNAILLAIQEDNAVGQTITISSKENVTWNNFFNSHSKIFPNPPPLLNISKKAIEHIRTRHQTQILKQLLSNPTHFFSNFPTLPDNNKLVDLLLFFTHKISLNTNLKNIAKKIMKQIFNQKLVLKNDKSVYLSEKRKTNSNESQFLRIPELWLEKSFTLPIQFPIDNAIKVLGFKPETSFEEGIEKTKNWLFSYDTKPELGSCETIFIPKNPISIHLKHRKYQINR